MAATPRIAPSHPQDRSTARWLVTGCLLSVILCPATFTGCRAGKKPSNVDPEEELKQQKAEKKKEDFELPAMSVLPSQAVVKASDDNASPFDDRLLSRVAVKPGHWVHTSIALKANNFDFTGELQTACINQQENIRLERSNLYVVGSRPAALPKGQTKHLESPLFVPLPTERRRKSVQIVANLASRSGGRVMMFPVFPTIRLRPNQYRFVLLSADSERFGYLKTLSSIAPPYAGWDFDGLAEDFLVTVAADADRVSLPQSALAMSSIAYVLWDSLDPDRLSADQQSALLDWLHWGGRLLVNGPSSLDQLRGSFLESVLPAKGVETVLLSDEAVQRLNENWWQKRNAEGATDDRLKLDDAEPWEVLRLQLTGGGTWVSDTANMVAERRTGRGNVIATSFDLGSRRLINWGGVDSFFNACLMRLPPRQFSRHDGESSFKWLDHDDYPLRDARTNCGLRYFSRDAAFFGEGRPAAGESTRNKRGSFGSEEPSAVARWVPVEPELQRWSLAQIGGQDGYREDPVAGLGGWSDFSSAANAARRSLISAAGISVPEKRFVAKILAVYLLCLVPLNWLLFRSIGRVEWAWFVAPAIAIAGALGVVRLAQLDIGFVRSRTEIAVLEAEANYPRVNVTRFCGLYTSLATPYTLTFADPGSVALPFSMNATEEELRLKRRQEVVFRQDKQVGLSGFPVLSNSTGMIRAEQMVDLAGPLAWEGNSEEGFVLTNRTGMWFHAASVLHRDGDRCRVATLGDLRPDGSIQVDEESFGDVEDFFQQLESDPATGSTMAAGELSLRGLIRLATDGRQLQDREYRLVAWSEQGVPGMTIRPKSNQTKFRTLLVANLAHGSLRMPRRDANRWEDYRIVETDEIEDVDSSTNDAQN